MYRETVFPLKSQLSTMLSMVNGFCEVKIVRLGGRQRGDSKVDPPKKAKLDHQKRGGLIS